MPFEIPESWEWLNLKSIGEVVTGSTPSKDHTEYYGGVFPFYKPSDLEQGINTIGASDSLTEDGYAVSRQIKKDSILVTCIGATIGKTGLIRLDGSCNQQINAIIPSNIVIPKYLYYNCISSYFQNEIKNRASATTLPILNKNKFSEILLPIPPINEQKRIVAKVEDLFSLIDELDTSEEELNNSILSAKSKILDLAIHGKLVPQDSNDEPASELLKRINPNLSTSCDNPHYENAPFEIPDGWSWCKLVDLCTFLSRGKSPKYTETEKIYPVFAQKCNLKEGGISLEKALFLEPSTLNKWPDIYHLQTGDVLVNSTGTGTVGRTRLFDESCLGKYKFVVPDSHVSVIRTHNEIVSKYIYALMSSLLVQIYIENNLAGSTNQKELYITVLQEVDVPLPPLNEQKRIVAKIEQLFSTLDTITTLLK